MKTTLMFSTILLAAAAIAAEIPATDVQIKGAVLAAPAELRDSATVLGYNPEGKMVVIREGKGDLNCLATDPNKPTFNVACYHKDLEPFMARGRELVAQKVTGQARTDLRFQEIKDGKLKMPKEPRTLYVLTGSAFDGATGNVTNSYLRWVIYSPYATPESTGLSTKGSDGAPWLMSPGTPGAHIMISPAKK